MAASWKNSSLQTFSGPFCGVDHRQDAVKCATTLLYRGECAVSEADRELKLDLECLRLASDLMQLSRDALNPDLQAHCIQMAKYWTELANRDPDQS